MDASDEARDRVGRLAGGYNRVVRDFDRAIHLAGLTSSQLLLVQQAREMSWSLPQIRGQEEPVPFRLNLSRIAAIARMARPNLSRQHLGLVSRRIFIDLGDGSNLINKDFRTWVDLDGSPLLDRAQIDHCKRISRKVRPVPSRTRSGCSVAYPPGHTTEVGSVSSRVQPPTTGLYPPGTTTDQAYREERADTPAPAPAELNSESLLREREDSCIPHLSPECAPVAERDRGEGPGPRPEADEAVAWAVERVGLAFPGDESIAELMPMWVRSWVAEGCTLVEIQDAVVKALGKVRRASGLVSYAKGCLDTRRRPAPPGLAAPTPAPTKPQSLADEFRRLAESQRKDATNGP